jgi:PAS domain S-box-containing protein
MDKSLGAVEERCRLLIETAQDFIYMVDADFSLTYLNRAAARSIHGRPEDLIGEPVAALFPQGTFDVGLRNIKHVLESGDEIRFDEELHFPGRVLWANTVLTPVKDMAGRVTGVMGITRDITELKQAEQGLRENEEKYHALVENAAEAIVIAQDGRLKYANPAASKITGYSRQELGFSPFLEFIHPEDRQIVSERYAKQIEGNESLRPYEFKLIVKAGKIKWMDIHSIRMTWEDRPAALSFLSDITERKRAEEALRMSEAQLSNALKMAHAGHWEYDVATDTFTFNENFYRIFRATAAEVGGYRMSSADYARRFCHPEDAALVGEETRAALQSSDPNYSRLLEHRILYADGEVGTISVRFFIVKDAQGRTVRTYGVNQDITERKKMEGQLQETLGSLRDALGGIIQVLSATLEKRDPYTAGHQRRVADLARAIGQEIGLSPECVEGLRLAGIIHDIGKISIPAEILCKPTKLTEIEYDLIRSHCQIGYDILKNIDFSWPIGKMILQHHERMNGSGYPHQLRGEDILIESRILAVSDVVEAMASHRPYRAALGIEAALQEIEADKGALYDPAVVAVCLKLFREKGYSLKD